MTFSIGRNARPAKEDIIRVNYLQARDTHGINKVFMG